jgi:hypothetical protein
MSLELPVRPHRWMSCVVAASLAACGAAGFGGGKLASRPGDAPTGAPSASARAAEPPRGDSHAAIDRVGAEPAPERPGLGTAWGEAVDAPISFTAFQRASPAPWAELALHYNDADGVAAHARHLGARPAPLELSTRDGAVAIALVDVAGRTLPGFTAGGRTLVIGEDGARYRIVVRNTTPARFEIVTSVDGLDVIDGEPADPDRRGYLIDPHSVLTIDGFRTSDAAVAAFRFGTVAASYAAQTSGDRDVGVIGFAVFAERGAAWTPRELGRRDAADPFPHRGYAAPPR